MLPRMKHSGILQNLSPSYPVGKELLSNNNNNVCVYVVLAPPSVLGEWSMALVLWLPFECLTQMATTKAIDQELLGKCDEGVQGCP